VDVHNAAGPAVAGIVLGNVGPLRIFVVAATASGHRAAVDDAYRKVKFANVAAHDLTVCARQLIDVLLLLFGNEGCVSLIFLGYCRGKTDT
jgi:hypothetical protein